MIDVLHLLEKLNILDNVEQWDKLREMRNIITHEYPLDIAERVENVELYLESYVILLSLFNKIKTYIEQKNLI